MSTRQSEYSYVEYMRDFIYFNGGAGCMAIIIYVFQDVYKKKLTYRENIFEA